MTAAEQSDAVRRWLGFVFAILAFLVPGAVAGAPLLARGFETLFTSSPEEPLPFDPHELEGALAALESTEPEERKNGITNLKIVVTHNSTPDEARRAVAERLAAYVRDFSPSLPIKNVNAYCSKPPNTRYPSEVQLALETVGASRAFEVNASIDLSSVNLAYASLQGLDFRGVRLDGSLMCRTFLADSKFDGATMEGTNFMLALMEYSLGLEVDQLSRTDSLYRTTLPRALTKAPALQDLRFLPPR